MSALVDDAKLVPWLWRIATLIAHEMRREALRRRGRFTVLEEETAGREESPGARSQEDERRARVREALGALPDEERMAIELNVFGGLTQTEIADALGWNVAKVKNRAKAGHAKLLEMLKDVDL